ncbi:14064_t:CDS:1, partial [Funneliformis geosporum]
EMMDDLEQISARIIDDINIFDSNNDDNLQPFTLLELFDSQIIKIALIQEINSI